jgi:hypothetical protein
MGAGDFSQRGVVEDDVSGYAVAARGLRPPSAQPLEEFLRRPGQRFARGGAYAGRALRLAPRAQ